jgi:23S rRNA (guanosine2251-2'-O)-methyltransferase
MLGLEEFISGKNPVIEALRSERSINKIWISDKAQPSQVQTIYQLAKEKGIIIQQVDKRKLDQTAGTPNHQGVVASVAAHEYVELDDLLEIIRGKGETPFLLLLDEIEDPHNLGSILRSADCTGVHGVVIPKRRAVGLTSTVAKTSAGAIEYVPVARVSNMAQTIDMLKKEGYWVTGTDATGEYTMGQPDYRVPTAIVIGSEGKGMGRLIREKCDYVVRIPMVGHVNSLNASVAAALVLFEVFKQRQE